MLTISSTLKKKQVQAKNSISKDVSQNRSNILYAIQFSVQSCICKLVAKMLRPSDLRI